MKASYGAGVLAIDESADMFSATYAWDDKQDAKIRTANFVDHGRFGNSSRENLAELFELNEVVGHEADDYQNPYAFMASRVLTYPGVYGTGLDPSYALGLTLDNEQDVALNIAATKNAIIHG